MNWCFARAILKLGYDRAILLLLAELVPWGRWFSGLSRRDFVLLER